MLDELVHFRSYCPKCETLQPTSVTRAWLRATLLKSGPLTVLGTRCGHTWDPSDQEREELKRRIQ